MLRIFKLQLFMFLILIVASCQQSSNAGTLKIQTIPDEMKIYINEELKGQSPAGTEQFFTINLSEGEYKLRVEKNLNNDNHTAGAKTVYVASNTEQVILIEAEEVLTNAGRLKAENAKKAKVITKKMELSESVNKATTEKKEITTYILRKYRSQTDPSIGNAMSFSNDYCTLYSQFKPDKQILHIPIKKMTFYFKPDSNSWDRLGIRCEAEFGKCIKVTERDGPNSVSYRDSYGESQVRGEAEGLQLIRAWNDLRYRCGGSKELYK